MSRSDKLQQEAEQLAQKKSIFGKSKNLQAAADRYGQAGNSYKIDREFVKAGECHMKAAELYAQVKEESTAADQAIEAGKCFEKESSALDQAINAYKFAANIFKDNPRKQYDLGQLYTNSASLLLQADRTEEGLELLNKGLGILKNSSGGSASSDIAKNLETWADALSDKGQYQKAIDFYQEVINIRLSNQMTQGSSGRLFFKAVLTYLQLNDMIGANKMIDAFLQKNPVFRNDFYYKFLAQVIPALDQNDLNAFDNCVGAFQRQSSVDPWTKRRLEKLRSFLDSPEEADDGGLC